MPAAIRPNNSIRFHRCGSGISSDVTQIVKQLSTKDRAQRRLTVEHAPIAAANEQVDHLHAIHRWLAFRYGFSDHWCRPLTSRTDGRVLGMLGFYCRSMRHPTASEATSMKTVGRLAALFIDRRFGEDEWRMRVVSTFAKTRKTLRDNVVVRPHHRDIPRQA